jgi:ABC-type dipeptide/oligopeptide/nickel transport system ATPase subunit
MEELTENEQRIPEEERNRVNDLPYTIPKPLREILNGFKWAIDKKNQSAVLIVDGRSGMGKTTLSFQIAKYMSPTFSLDDVCFSPEKFLDELSKTQKGNKRTLIFDEAMLLSSRAALSAINRMIVVAMSMIRSKNICIIFNVNSIFDIDRNLALSRADLLLHCYGDSLTDKGKFLAFFKGGDGHDRIKDLYINGKKFYSYNYPTANFINTFSGHFVLNENEYEARKQEGVNKFLSSSGSKMANKDKNSRNKAIIAMYETGQFTMKSIADKLDISHDTVQAVMDEAREAGLTEA